MVALHVNDTFKVTKIVSAYSRRNFNSYKGWINNGLDLYLKAESELFNYKAVTITASLNNSPKGIKLKKIKKIHKKKD